MKFIVYSVPDTDEVKLELYIDTTDGENGGTWHLVHETTDSPGDWTASGGEDVPDECDDDTPDGSPVYGARDDCFLRSDSSHVRWKNVSIRRITPTIKNSYLYSFYKRCTQGVCFPSKKRKTSIVKRCLEMSLDYFELNSLV